MSEQLDQLVAMSGGLCLPVNDYVILGEGAMYSYTPAVPGAAGVVTAVPRPD